ncbi:MAG: hypothetical protein ACTSQY_00175 [Candidatus Odinarchaeia archaeon]|nr:MAG: hypothetical protein [Lokiarchaeota virus Fenrir Meg22_1012]URC17214.1 MAG: hypothetical protein [Lokiarchaeota virus Fenrir Meg22_1214]
MPTNEYERDFEEISKDLDLPGYYTSDLFSIGLASDGKPGLQGAFVNWTKRILHDGVLDFDMDLNGFKLLHINGKKIKNTDKIQTNKDNGEYGSFFHSKYKCLMFEKDNKKYIIGVYQYD